MEIKVLSADLALAGPVAPAALAQVAESGFRSVIDGRPGSRLRDAARVLGLGYAQLPPPGGEITPLEVERLRALLASLPKPILACDGAGERSSELYRLAVLPA